MSVLNSVRSGRLLVVMPKYSYEKYALVDKQNFSAKKDLLLIMFTIECPQGKARLWGGRNLEGVEGSVREFGRRLAQIWDMYEGG